VVAKWIRAAPDRFVLGPGEARSVTVEARLVARTLLVLDGDGVGAPWAGGILELGPDSFGGSRHETQTDASGRASLELPEGIYWLATNAGGSRRERSRGARPTARWRFGSPSGIVELSAFLPPRLGRVFNDPRAADPPACRAKRFLVRDHVVPLPPSHRERPLCASALPVARATGSAPHQAQYFCRH
jgi:hypothetical protein